MSKERSAVSLRTINNVYRHPFDLPSYKITNALSADSREPHLAAQASAVQFSTVLTMQKLARAGHRAIHSISREHKRDMKTSPPDHYGKADVYRNPGRFTIQQIAEAVSNDPTKPRTVSRSSGTGRLSILDVRAMAYHARNLLEQSGVDFVLPEEIEDPTPAQRNDMLVTWARAEEIKSKRGVLPKNVDQVRRYLRGLRFDKYQQYANRRCDSRRLSGFVRDIIDCEIDEYHPLDHGNDFKAHIRETIKQEIEVALGGSTAITAG